MCVCVEKIFWRDEYCVFATLNDAEKYNPKIGAFRIVYELESTQLIQWHLREGDESVSVSEI